jgi:hypothetical protein
MWNIIKIIPYYAIIRTTVMIPRMKMRSTRTITKTSDGA